VSVGTARTLWGLARPRGAVWVVLLPLIGFAFGHWDRALTFQGGPRVAVVMVAWALLHAGTMWLNAALDRDGGEVLYGAALPVPPVVVPAGYGALALGVALAAAVHPASGLCALGCAVLAVLYSHPRTGWKGRPVLGPAVNVVGYAGLSPLAGWVLVRVVSDTRTLLSWALLGAWMLGCYFAAQAFQQEEDAARGYRTLVATRGPRAAVLGAWIGLGGAAGAFFVLTALGWFPRVALLALPVFAWATARLRADRVHERGWAGALFARLLVFGWVLLALVSVEYVRESFADEPVAGLGTAAGFPPDRPRLPPAAMRRWERLQAGQAATWAPAGWSPPRGR